MGPKVAKKEGARNRFLTCAMGKIGLLAHKLETRNVNLIT